MRLEVDGATMKRSANLPAAPAGYERASTRAKICIFGTMRTTTLKTTTNNTRTAILPLSVVETYSAPDADGPTAADAPR